MRIFFLSLLFLFLVLLLLLFDHLHLQCSVHTQGFNSHCVCWEGEGVAGSFSFWILWTDRSLKVAPECTRSFVAMCPLQLGYFSPLQVEPTYPISNFFCSRIQKFSVRFCFSKLIETKNLISHRKKTCIFVFLGHKNH